MTTLQEMAQTRKRKLANNTYLVVKEDGTLSVRLHETEVITFHVDGRIVLDSGGWQTKTTKDRINSYLPDGWQIRQEKGIWVLDNGRDIYGYQDGITIQNGKVTGYDTEPPSVKLKLAKDINFFAKGYGRALVDGEIPAPSNGDCWYCLFPMPGTDHLLLHIEEPYYVPSLLNRAAEDYAGLLSIIAKDAVARVWGGETLGEWQRDITKDQVSKVIRRYMRRELGLTC